MNGQIYCINAIFHDYSLFVVYSIAKDFPVLYGIKQDKKLSGYVKYEKYTSVEPKQIMQPSAILRKYFKQPEFSSTVTLPESALKKPALG